MLWPNRAAGTGERAIAAAARSAAAAMLRTGSSPISAPRPGSCTGTSSTSDRNSSAQAW